MAGERPNFYLLLELDPAVDDWPTIERRLREKREQWARDRTQGSPRAKRRAEAALPLLPDIGRVLREDASRKEEARQARRQRDADRGRDLGELDEAIALLRVGGGEFDPTQRQKLLQQFSGRLSTTEIDERLRSAGLRQAGERAEEPTARPAPESLDKTLLATLRKNLEVLGLANLYDLLELRQQSTPLALLDRAQALYGQSIERGRADAESAATNELLGICRKVFATEIEKAKYDRALALAALEELKPSLELAGTDGLLVPEEIEQLVQRARRKGISSEDARAFIADYANRRKWRLQGRPGGAALAEPLLCGFCSQLSPPDATACKSCGEPLRIACPRCQQANPTSDTACSRCGTRVGDAPLVSSLLREGERQALAGDLTAALAHVERALHYWPEWAPAEAAHQKIIARRAEREAATAEVEALVRERKLTAARIRLERLERELGLRAETSLRERIESGLARAQAAFDRGDALRQQLGASALDRALDCFEEALDHCADFEAARRALATYPPPAPTRLDVTATPFGYRLAWQISPAARPAVFRVLRKERTAPRDAADGELLAELSACSLDDPSASVGTVWHYAVFRLRGGVASSEAARSGPRLRTAEVDSLEALPGEGQVQLRWKSPPGALRVEVWRRTAAKADAEVRLSAAGSSAIDSGLTNGIEHSYRVVAVFADPVRAGAEIFTAGAQVSARPVTPPRPVSDLVAERRGAIVSLRWTPISEARVELRWSRGRGALTNDTVVPLEITATAGQLIPIATDGVASFPLPEPGRYVFTPFTLKAATAVVGTACELVAIDPVTSPAARRTAAGLALTWTWPDGVSAAVVAWSAEAHPRTPGTGPGHERRITRAEYDRLGCFLLPSSDYKGKLFIAIFATTSEEDLFAEPALLLESDGRVSTVRYAVGTRKALLSRRIEDAWIELESGDGLNRLPPLIVVGKERDVPISASDGEVVTELAAIELSRGRARIAVPRSHLERSLYLKLFFRDSNHSKEIRLLPAAREGLRIG